MTACSLREPPSPVKPASPLPADPPVTLDTMDKECDALLAALGTFKECPHHEPEDVEDVEAWIDAAKRNLDQLSGVAGWRLHDLRRTCVSGMARLGIAPHIADKILNHQSGTISGVAAVYQRHDFLTERKNALERWGSHVGSLLTMTNQQAA